MYLYLVSSLVNMNLTECTFIRFLITLSNPFFISSSFSFLSILLSFHYFLSAYWSRRWIPNPGVTCSKPLGGSKVDSAFHSSKVDQMSTSSFWELSGKKVNYLLVNWLYSLVAAETHPQKETIYFLKFLLCFIIF